MVVERYGPIACRCCPAICTQPEARINAARSCCRPVLAFHSDREILLLRAKKEQASRYKHGPDSCSVHAYYAGGTGWMKFSFRSKDTSSCIETISEYRFAAKAGLRQFSRLETQARWASRNFVCHVQSLIDTIANVEDKYSTPMHVRMWFT